MSIVDDHERVMEVVVEDKQLSLAIGKKGQNVRLAAKLTGWRIDIKSEEEKRREVEAQFGELAAPAEDGAETAAPESGDAETSEAAAGESEAAADETAAGQDVASPDASDVPVPYTLAGIGEKTVRKLVEGGFATLEALGGATAEQLSAIPGIGGKTAEKILTAARGETPADAAGEET